MDNMKSLDEILVLRQWRPRRLCADVRLEACKQEVALLHRGLLATCGNTLFRLVGHAGRVGSEVW